MKNVFHYSCSLNVRMNSNFDSFILIDEFFEPVNLFYILVKISLLGNIGPILQYILYNDYRVRVGPVWGIQYILWGKTKNCIYMLYRFLNSHENSIYIVLQRLQYS